MTSFPSLRTTGPQPPILLVYTPTASAQRMAVDTLLEKARSVFGTTVQIVRINETTHPEVVRSFGFTAGPAFVLLQRGLELWRYSGSIDSPELFSQLGLS